MGNAASLFYSADPDVQTLYRRIRPNADQEKYLQAKWQAVAEYLTAAYQKQHNVPTRTWLQGSYKFGTLIRPLVKGSEFDVDLGFFAQTDRIAAPSESAQATKFKGNVRTILQRYIGLDADAGEVCTPKERCERIKFARDFHLDVPTYELVQKRDERWLATETRGWENSDPKALHVWFIENVDTPGRNQIRRFVCYLKAWAGLAYIRLGHKKPSSIMLTILATEIYLSLDGKETEGPEDEVFATFVRSLVARFEKSTEVRNPVNQSENLNRQSASGSAVLLAQLRQLHKACQDALAAGSEVLAAIMWTEVFGQFFPLPVDTAKSTESRNLPALITPTVGIQIFDERNIPVASGVNAISRIAKKRVINFSISNADRFPGDAEIQWVVRNSGKEAEAVNDLGHSRKVTVGHGARENTLYAGQQYMDCVVKRHGQIIGFRRVPVNILN